MLGIEFAAYGWKGWGVIHVALTGCTEGAVHTVLVASTSAVLMRGVMLRGVV